MIVFPAPALILPPDKPAIVRAADLSGVPTLEDFKRRTKEATFPFPVFSPGVAVLTRIAASSISSTFMFTGSGAAEAHLNDNNDATGSADGTGLTSGTRAAYDFGSAVAIRRVRLITFGTTGFSNTITFNIRYSDTDLTSGFSTVSGAVTQIVATAGTSNESIANIDANGSHRYWAIEYASGTTGGNAWLGGLDMSHYV